MKKNYLFFAILMLSIWGLIYNPVYSQIAAWQANGITETQTTLDASLADHNLTVTPVSLGDGLSRTGLANAFSTLPGVATTNDDAGVATAIANGDYFEFSLIAKTNYKLSLSAVTFKVRVSNTNRWFLLRYSINGGEFADAAVRTAYSGSSGGNGVIQDPVDLTDIAELQNVGAGTTVTFRLYHGGANNLTSTTALGRSLTETEYALSVTGNVEPTVAPNSILAWQFAVPQSGGNEAAYNANIITTGLEPAALVRGAGLRTTTSTGGDIVYSGAFVTGATVGTVATSAADIADAIANDLYFAFEVKPSANYVVSLSTLRTKVRASGGGAKTWLWRYSTDGTNFNDIGTAYYNPGTITGGVHMPELDLTGIAELQNVTPSTTIYFRLYLQGSNAITGSSGIGISSDANGYVLSLDGTVSSTLPVKLTTFTGEAAGNHIKLFWETASEKNNSHFEVLRIQEGKEAFVIGTVSGKGTTDELESYSFTDTNPVNGINYYQLRQVDYNGKSELSGIISVKSGLTEQVFNAFFNNDILNISFDAEKAESFDVLLSDLSGKIIIRKPVQLAEGENLLEIPANIQQGIYVATLISGNKTIISKKVIKQ